MKIMDAGKPNNSLAGKLDNLQALPESFTFHSEKVWNKLERELRPNKRKYLLDYAAASLLIFTVLTVTPTWESNTSYPVNVKRPIASRQIKTPIANDVTRKENSKAIDTKLVKASIKNLHPDKNISRGIILVEPFNVAEAASPALDVDSVKLIEPTVTTVAVPIKQKFPIAHINELNEQPRENEPILTRTASAYPFKKQLIYSQYNTVSAGVANKSSEKKQNSFPFINLK
jgi:hypothetical protein